MFQTSDILKKRVYALTTDLFIIVLSNYFIMASFINFLKVVFFHFSLQSQIFLVQKFGMMNSISLISLTFSYFSIFYYVTNGRTMGKILFGLKVMTPDGDLTIKQAMQRAFAYFACAFFGSFLFALSFIRKDNKSLADVLSGTTVDFDIQNERLDNLSGTEFQLALCEFNSDENENIEQNKAA